jgi:polyisoprenoid-binding protein YceI
MYTAIAKRFYVPDPDLGWRVSTQHPIWLGLDACAMIAAVAFVLAVATVVIQRREHTRRTRMTILRVVSWSVALLSLTVPAAAFVSGPGPLRGRDTLPPSAAVLIESGIEGAIDAPAGKYAVVSHPGTSVTARLSAGGEAFDARFARDITGTWHGNPRDLSRPMHAEVGVATASIDTGIAERSKHAREGYLQADKFPQITVALDRVTAVRANGLQQVVFRAPGTVRLMGRSHPVEIAGRMQKPDDAARERLGLIGDVLLVQADFTLAINETALASKSRDFDGDRIPLHVSLVLRHTGN